MNKNSQDYLRIAIFEEQQSGAMYEKYADITRIPSTKKLLTLLASMEYEHEAKLKELLNTGKSRFAREEKRINLPVTDNIIRPEIKENSSMEEVFIYAIKAEERACIFYRNLASLEDDPECLELFKLLAAQEQKHKTELEKEYQLFYPNPSSSSS